MTVHNYHNFNYMLKHSSNNKGGGPESEMLVYRAAQIPLPRAVKNIDILSD